MKRVTGIGGIFLTAKDPVALRAWYQKHLGIDVQDWGGTAFRWVDDSGKAIGGMTIWSIGGGGVGELQDVARRAGPCIDERELWAGSRHRIDRDIE